MGAGTTNFAPMDFETKYIAIKFNSPRLRADQRGSGSKQQESEGVDAVNPLDQALLDKIKQLPPQRMAEVEDFVDFLRAREEAERLAHAAARTSEASFAQVWNNSEDEAYDRM